MARRRTTVATLVAVLALCAFTPASAWAGRYVEPVFGEVAGPVEHTYGAALNNRVEVQSLELDVYEPVGDVAEARPAIVFAFGGGFRDGHKRDQRIVNLLRAWARHGYATFAIEYRLRPSGTPNARTDPELVMEAATGDSQTIRDAQHDMQAAVRWVRAHAAELRVDPDLIAVGGESAGAITAWEAGINPEDPGTSGTPGVASDVAAVISLWGAADPDHVEAGSPPVIDLHGAADTTVPLLFGTQACALTTAFGDVCEHVIWPAARHAAFDRSDDIIATGANFLCRRVVPGCTAPAPAAPVSVH